ncbi:septum formation initiator family protein [Curtobacterium sp. MCBD17_034]|uniref:FtsB family cell division protein n=1 Tax=unclassified Curtobacterium TaxID=257496 RepID=UPI000DAA74C6|nr:MULTISPECIES: septum formation initiator family protein [unclassified Curtobacterium]PZF55450.1 septum formation initiator family protein [Curtobacterium sp. MCBD17_034]PZM33231.1 septum formation initiator family protein [Curtobacterium sp. MCBD17_031]
MPSTKPRVRRVPIAMPAATSPSGAWFRNIRFSGFSVLMLGIVVLFVVVLAPSLRTLIQQQQEIAQKEQQVAAQRADVATKKRDVARWDDPAYIEAQARDRLLYVYPGETSYLVMGAGSGSSSGSTSAVTTDSGTPVSSKLQTPKVDWVQAMLSSVLESGLTAKTTSELVAPDVSGSGTPTTGATAGTGAGR